MEIGDVLICKKDTFETIHEIKHTVMIKDKSYVVCRVSEDRFYVTDERCFKVKNLAPFRIYYHEYSDYFYSAKEIRDKKMKTIIQYELHQKI